jgi:hypothetical protein
MAVDPGHQPGPVVATTWSGLQLIPRIASNSDALFERAT